MPWYERLRGYLRSDRAWRAEMENRLVAHDRKLASHDERLKDIEGWMPRIIRQCRFIVESVVKQFTGRK